MKICIIGHTEKNYLPYIDRYITLFEQEGIEYDVIYWQREKMPENAAKNEYNFFEEAKPAPINKILSYLSYKKFVLSILKKNKYDKLIVLTTVPAIFLSGFLKKHYKNKYLLDIRDYSFEKFAPYKRMVDSLIEASEFTTISSRGFMQFLAENKKIAVTHNIPAGMESIQFVDFSKKDVINIGFVGGVRYFNENVFFISKLKQDENLKLFYIGKQTEGCDLQGYCKEHDVQNVEFIGKYENSQKTELYQKIDIINSIYGNNSLEVTTALPNRLYEACLLKKPIISSKGTFLSEVILKHGLGVVLDVEKDDVHKVISEYIKGFDASAFSRGCEEFLSEVYDDEKQLSKKLLEFCSN